ncbi:MAG: RecB family exonuclease [Streptosporangiaceae bacterium]
MLTISNSEIYAWTRCRRNWLLTYYYGLVPADEIPHGNRQLGSRVHTCLEGRYGYGLDSLTVMMLLYNVEISKHPEFEAELKEERAMAEAMLTGYEEWLAESGEDADLEVVATETDLQVPLPGVDGVMLRARMDQVYRKASNSTLGFMDYKTGGFERHESLALDPQMKFYSLLQFLSTQGQPVPGMTLRDDVPLVNGGLITTLKRVKRTARAAPPFYKRDEFRFTIEQLSAHLLKVQSVCAEITQARDSLNGTQTAFPGDMTVFNAAQRGTMYPTPILGNCEWWCPFSAGPCVMMDDGSDWVGALFQSGRYIQADPYEYYRTDALRTIREELARL